MGDGDFLLIGNGLDTRNAEEILKAYDNLYLDNLLIKTLTQIGFKKEDLIYGARFKNSRVEMYYTVKKDIKITFLDKTVYSHDFNGTQSMVNDSFHGRAGCNGTMSLKFSTPMYLWLLENM